MGFKKRKTPSNNNEDSSSSSFNRRYKKRATTNEVKSKYFSPPNYSYYPKPGERSLRWNFNMLTPNKKEELMKQVFKTRLNHYSIRGIIDDIKKYYIKENHRQPKEWDHILNENKENYSRENYEIFENQSIKDHDFLMSNIKLVYYLLKDNHEFYWKYLNGYNNKKLSKWNDIDNTIYGRWLRKKLGLKEIKELCQEYLNWTLLDGKCNSYFNTNKTEWPLLLPAEPLYYKGLQELLDFILKLDLDDEEAYELFEKQDSDDSDSDSDNNYHLPNYRQTHQNLPIDNSQSVHIIVIDE